ncbi:hypothetical protein OC834_005242 [Tilletia horrida]|nr:hypothetical protein OC834_005242 [Tilletia horrida]
MDPDPAATSSGHAPAPVVAASLPHPLSQYAESLEPIFDNCGAMTNALHMLGDAETRLEDASLRNEQHLQASQAKLRADLEDLVKRLKEETTQHEARIKHESLAHQARINAQLDKMLSQVGTDLSGSEEYSRRTFKALLTATKACNAQVTRTVRQGQRVWMHMQAQLISFNAWAVAWPEAIRVSGQDDDDDDDNSNDESRSQRGNPPRYELRSLAPIVMSTGLRAQTDGSA